MVNINAREYEAAHGKAPRGRGNWAFCPTRHVNADNYLDFVFWVHGRTYAEAKRVAMAHFAPLGVWDVTVCS
jgi:hypothetical protein